MIPKTCGICLAVTEISSWKELKLVPSFLLSSFLLARRSCTLIKIKYAVALLTIIGNRMAQGSSQYHLPIVRQIGDKIVHLMIKA